MESPRQVRFSHPPKISQSSKVYKCASLVLQRLNEQRGCDLFCDVVLVVEQEKVPAHRNVLAACSDCLYTMFRIGMREAYQKEVELFGVTCLGFKAILDFLYSDDLFLNSGNVDSILETTHLLQNWKVVDFCCEYLGNEVDEENYFYLQELASIFNLKRLDSFIDAFIMKNFVTLLLNFDFLQNVTVEKPLTWAVRACKRTVHSNCCLGRKKEAYRVLENIHFPLIPEIGLLHLVKPTIGTSFPKKPAAKSLSKRRSTTATRWQLSRTTGQLSGARKRNFFLLEEKCLSMAWS
ncbi:hypothetical protein E2320_001262 [Naja naja]|nr:hypothetical protein E2320_001262 [Naja naja]